MIKSFCSKGYYFFFFNWIESWFNCCCCCCCQTIFVRIIIMKKKSSIYRKKTKISTINVIEKSLCVWFGKSYNLIIHYIYDVCIQHREKKFQMSLNQVINVKATKKNIPNDNVIESPFLWFFLQITKKKRNEILHLNLLLYFIHLVEFFSFISQLPTGSYMIIVIK